MGERGEAAGAGVRKSTASAHPFLGSCHHMFPAQLSEARIAWSMSSVLTTIVDDLFDTGESMEELQNLATLFDLYACSRHTQLDREIEPLTRLT